MNAGFALPEVEYPLHQRTITNYGRICLGKKKISLSHVFAGQNVGIEKVEDNIWLVSFMHYDIGYFDLEACRVEPVGNPFGPKMLTMCPAPCARIVVAWFEVEPLKGEKRQ